ncbi:MAG: RsmE family RNA methyltransferase [Coriobacteriia bacterium]|nr:RsmE family RNA methyltransferase [Coriobacteriia bacterium]
MSLQHIFLDDQVLSQETADQFELRVSADDLRHLKVLRVRIGEHVAVVDAASDYFECEFTQLDGDLPIVRICQRLDRKLRPQVLLVQGLAKGDKMDEVIRHATELGVSGFLPLKTERSVMKLDPKKAQRKLERWRSIARSAAQQSGQPQVPKVFEPMITKQAVEMLRSCTCVAVCWEEAPTSLGMGDALRAARERCGCAVASDARVAIVVGPEGGLSESEVSQFMDGCENGQLVSLGPSILRTETAGIVAPALALYELGAMGQTS